jgi:hypothetical protein
LFRKELKTNGIIKNRQYRNYYFHVSPTIAFQLSRSKKKLPERQKFIQKKIKDKNVGLVYQHISQQQLQKTYKGTIMNLKNIPKFNYWPPTCPSSQFE